MVGVVVKTAARRAAGGGLSRAVRTYRRRVGGNVATLSLVSRFVLLVLSCREVVNFSGETQSTRKGETRFKEERGGLYALYILLRVTPHYRCNFICILVCIELLI